MGLREFSRGGIVGVYRGQKYANEQFVTSGEYGEHDDAYYQWGIEGNLGKDGAGLRANSGSLVLVFDWTDNWQLPLDEQNRLESEREERRQARTDFVVQLSLSFENNGLNMKAYPEDTTLAIESDEFRDIEKREQYLNALLSERKFRQRLCELGFSEVYAYYSKGMLSGNIGRRVGIECP